MARSRVSIQCSSRSIHEAPTRYPVLGRMKVEYSWCSGDVRPNGGGTLGCSRTSSWGHRSHKGIWKKRVPWMEAFLRVSCVLAPVLLPHLTMRGWNKSTDALGS